MKYIDQQIEYFKGRKEQVLKRMADMGIDVENFKTIPELPRFKLKAKSLKELKVACIMDRFTLDSYAPECQLMELTPGGWREEIEEFEPELIFVESAWQGKDKLWYRKIANGSKEYFELTSYCQEKGIPVVFWNKEDPVYTDTFMPAARMADFVFTTDIDCVKKYKETLKHDQVYFLHFAAQPEIHNPIEKYDRKDKYCFAGAYYHKYKKRAEVFDKFAEFFINTKGFDIYDRNFKNSLPEHAFPTSYSPYILGQLEPNEIDVAYKGYNYGINMNSVDQSQTMFARRVFEMLASNTVTVGNYSRGVKNLFGDLTISTNDSQTLDKSLQTWCKDEVNYRKYRLAGLRCVLRQHLYEDRLSYIVQKVFGVKLKKELPSVFILAKANCKEEMERLHKCFVSQKYTRKYLIIVCEEKLCEKSKDNIVYLTEESFKQIDWNAFPADSYVGVMDANNYYGPNYMQDLMLSLRYGDFSGVGKRAFYKFENSNYVLKDKEAVYKYTASLHVDRALFSIEICLKENETVQSFLEKEFIEHSGLFATDEFNFCQNLVADSSRMVDDLVIIDQGIDVQRLEMSAEAIRRDLFDEEQGVIITAEDIYSMIKKAPSTSLRSELKNDTLFIASSLKEKENGYIYLEKIYTVDDYKTEEGIRIMFEGKGTLDFFGVCVFLDDNKKSISPVFTRANRISVNSIPEQAKYFKLGLRVQGKGEFKLKEIGVGITSGKTEKSCFLSRSNVLILTNQYPSAEALYRNMFVHKRVMAYKEEGQVFDVMRMNIYAKNEFSEFEGINIVEGQSKALAEILENSNIDTVCVHFLDRQMWDVLKNYSSKIRILVWVHGSEIQPWWRREYNYTTTEELEKAKKESEIRLQFWAEVFDVVDDMDIHFIFVSQYFADEIFEDNKVMLPQSKYSIIHNCIDAEMFNYVPKNVEQRKKLLSIRPYASNKYANDLTVKCILELSRKPYFKDLEFMLIGNGEQFDETLKPLKKFRNVTLKKTFLRQDEIASLHKEYGIFITPTRMDAQGVSRDEAMSSGLVPVTNAVTAIPEFVDETCGILAPGEDYHAMAEGIEHLYLDEDFFGELSKNAADRVRRQTTKEFTITKELELIG